MYKFAITLFFFAFCSQVLAQKPVRLGGRILNEKNEGLPGASIIVEGTNQRAAADVEGRFVFNLETGKKYTLTVSNVGYATKAVSDIEVGEGIDNNLEIILTPSVQSELSGVVVRSTRRQESTNALIAFQRNNTALSSGLAADFIRRTPDRNTGEVLKRVSGASIQDNKFVVIRGLSDRYNSAFINGAQFPSTEPDKKAFSFDVIPASLVDNIIISKTATPDITGEFAGGLVQITTKDVPTKDILSLGVNFGFNTNSTFKKFLATRRSSTDWLGFDNGDRSLPSAFPATRQGYNVKDLATQVELSKLFSSDAYQQVERKARPVQNYNLTYGIGRKLKNDASLGVIAGVIYRTNDQIGSVARQFGQQDIDVIDRSLTDDQNRYSVNVGGLLNLSYSLKKTRISFKNLINQSYEDNFYTRSGTDFTNNSDVLFQSSFVNQRTLYTSQLEADRQLTAKGIRLRLNGNFAYNKKTQPDLRTVSYSRSTGTSDPFGITFDETNRFFSNLHEYSYGGGGHLLVPFKSGSENQTFKAGGNTLIRIRDFNSRNFRYEDASQSAGSLKFLPFNQIFNQENISEKGFVLDETTQNEDKYFGVSVLNAGFLMMDNRFSEKFRLIWGARAENFQQFLTTRRSDLKRVVIHTDVWDILPSVNAIFNLNPKNIIRVSGSQTVARPEFREIAPFSFFDFEQNYAVSGDTTLQRSRIYNGDLRYELYPRAGESISLGVFYKKFEDPIELRARNRNPSRYSYQNADNATSYGFELEARKNLDVLGDAFTNFSLFSNLTYIKSEVELQSTSSDSQSINSSRPLQGQSPYLVNVGLQYTNEKNGVNGSLLYNRIGERLALVGDEVLGVYDIYERPRNQLDLQLSKKISKRAELKLNVSDILNNDYYFYENIDNKHSFKSSSDRKFSSYSPGTSFTLGFTYDFIK